MSGDNRGKEELSGRGVSTSPDPGGFFTGLEWHLPLDGRGDSFEPVPFVDSNDEEEAAYHFEDAAEDSNNKRNAADDTIPSVITAISRRKKKPKGMPKRPLSAYNLFFQRERPRILLADSEACGEDGKRLAFDELGKIIGQRWRALSTEDRQEYEDLAVQDSMRYRREMEAFNDAKRKKIDHIEKGSPILSAAEDSCFPPLRGLENGGWMLSPDVSNESSGTGRGNESVAYPPPLQARVAPPETGHYLPPPPQNHLQQYHPEQQSQGAYASYYLPPVYTNVPPPPTARPQAPPPHIDPSAFPIPPGMELMLPDRDGRERKYKVQYTCYSMTREAAQQYIERLSANHPPPPPPQSDDHVGGSQAARYPPSWGSY